MVGDGDRWSVIGVGDGFDVEIPLTDRHTASDTLSNIRWTDTRGTHGVGYIISKCSTDRHAVVDIHVETYRASDSDFENVILAGSPVVFLAMATTLNLIHQFKCKCSIVAALFEVRGRRYRY
jgi:hypothetical protein